MTLSEGWNLIYLLVLPLLAASGVISLLVWLVGFYFGVTGKRSGYWIYILAFALLGTVAGIVAGNSREPAISAVLPALLALVTALCGYAFTVEGLKDLRPAIPFCILALMLSSIYGLAFGATLRGKYDRYMLHYQNVDLEVEKAQKLKELELQADHRKK
jgi:predicted neutral ceramidase superfamily lipid hydrolase